MGIRGRKSAALAVVGSGGVIPRPEPPEGECLTEEQTREWYALVNCLPADFFRRESHGLLTQYCREIVTARKVAQIIQTVESGKALDIEEYDRLLKMQERQSRTIASLATRMRLSQQATASADKTKPTITLNPFEED